MSPRRGRAGGHSNGTPLARRGRRAGLAWLLAAACTACGGAQHAGAPGGGRGAVPGDTANSGATGQGEGAAPSGPKAPDFSLPTLDGDQISLSDFRGEKVVLIDFWSTTCDPCLREMPELVKLYEAKKSRGFEVLAISVDGPDTQAAIPSKVQSTGMSFPILLDQETEVMDRYNPKGVMPFTVLVDRAGAIVLRRSGYQPGDAESMNKLRAAIDGALDR